MTDIFEQLQAPFPADRVSWRVGSTTADKKKGLAFAYIDARDVMERLDDVVGPGCWQCRYPHATGKTVCEIGIYLAHVGKNPEYAVNVDPQWVWKADGAGDTDVEAEKGALSDAFKRAAVRWGIGRYLYDLESVWVEIEPAGKSFRIKDSEKSKLVKLLGGKPDTGSRVTTGPQNPSSKAIYIASNIDGCISIGELDNYVANIRDDVPKMSQVDQDFIRSRFGTRKKLLKSQEKDAA